MTRPAVLTGFCLLLCMQVRTAEAGDLSLSPPVAVTRVDVADGDPVIAALWLAPLTADANINQVIGDQMSDGDTVHKYDSGNWKKAIKVDSFWKPAVNVAELADLDLTAGDQILIENLQGSGSSQEVYFAGLVLSRSEFEEVAGSNTTDIATILPPCIDAAACLRSDVPFVSGLKLARGGKSVKMTIDCGFEGAVDILYQDTQPDAPIDLARGWRVAEVNIPADKKVKWEDAGSQERPAISEVYCRIYLVGSTADENHDGFPDFRAAYATEDARIIAHTLGVTAPASNATSQVSIEAGKAANASYLLGSVVHVNKRHGHYSHTGRSPVIVGHDGPKSTINEALSKAEPGDTVVIQEGTYVEDVDFSVRKDIQVRFEGNVTILDQKR